MSMESLDGKRVEVVECEPTRTRGHRGVESWGTVKGTGR